MKLTDVAFFRRGEALAAHVATTATRTASAPRDDASGILWRPCDGCAGPTRFCNAAMSFAVDIAGRLKERNEAQADAFRDVFSSYQALVRDVAEVG